MGTDDATVGDGTDATALTAERVRRVVAGDDRAFGELYDAWFDRVHDLAFGVVRDRALAADVAQDTFLRAWQDLGTLRDPTSFGGWLLRIARNTALNRLRHERRAVAVDDESMAVIERAGPSPASAPAGFRVEDRLGAADDPSAAVVDAEIVTLVQDALDGVDGRDQEVLHLGLRYGLTPAEIGEAVGLNRNAANQAVHRARRRLRTAVEARVLWRRGDPECPDLAAALTDAGVTRFDTAAVAVVDAHAQDCERCAERRRLRLDPAVLFGAVPLVAAPGLLKTRVAQALVHEGVPMGGSAHAGGDPSSAQPGADGAGDPPPDGAGEGAGEGAGDGAGEGAGDGAADGAAGDAGGTVPVEVARSGTRRGWLVAAAVAVAVLAGGGIVALATTGADPETRAASTPRRDDLAAPVTTGPTVAPTTAPEPEPVGAPEATTPRVVTPPVVPTDPPPPPPTDPPPGVTGSIAVTPSSKSPGTWPMTQFDAPVLTWSTEHGASVSVEGPGVSRNDASGSVLLCPPSGASGPVCPSPPVGTYVYRLTVRDASGAIVLTRQAQLVVG